VRQLAASPADILGLPQFRFKAWFGIVFNRFVQLNDQKALEDLSMHRRNLAVDLKGKTGLNLSQSIRQIDEEIAVIEAGLERFKSADRA
jgi:hypothetical protein